MDEKPPLPNKGTPRTEATAVSIVSFVIPARNEERHLVSTIRSIRAGMAGGARYEIIVVDNGSTDGTRRLARAEGAHVLTQNGGTIGSLRNRGAREAVGEVVVFLDADVTLTSEWPTAFEEARAILQTRPDVLAGSACSVPAAASWIERNWFIPNSDKTSSHLGSAHLIVDRQSFLDIGGFDESLETGEDHDLSMRVIRAGGALHRLPATVVQHYGFPKTLSHFFRREVWHGRGDAVSLGSVARSKVALVAIAFGSLHVLAIAFLLAGRPLLALLSAAGILLICVASAVRRYRGQRPVLKLMNAGLFYLYYVARLVSLVSPRRRPHPRGGASTGASAVGAHWR